GLLIWAAWRWQEPSSSKPGWKWLVLALLVMFVPVVTLFLGLRLPLEKAVLIPGLPVEVSSPVMMCLSAIPWVLAGGLLGPMPAAILGFFSGLMMAGWSTHSLFTPIEVAGLAFLYSQLNRQRYRQPFYAFLRHPLGSALVMSVAFAPVYIFTYFFAVRGSLAVRLDYSLTQTWVIMLVRACELMVAGVVGELIYLAKPVYWGRKGALEPSPIESSLQKRFMFRMLPLGIVMFLTLLIGDWLVAGKAAQDLLEDRLSSTAKVAAESMPYFLETGQNLILTLADEELLSLPPEVVESGLADRLRTVPYFRQLYLFDENGNPVSGYPVVDVQLLRLSAEEEAGIQLALNGVLIQTYTIPPWLDATSAQVSFMAAIPDAGGAIKGVLIGRTDMLSNPFTQPAIKAMSTLQDLQGEGLILDENGRVLYHTIPSMIMDVYDGAIPEPGQLTADVSFQNTRQYTYYQLAKGRPWAVLLIIPGEAVQQLALNISIPLLVILIILLVFTYAIIQISLRNVTLSLEKLAGEATLIAKGRLDHDLQIEGVDEVGQFGQAFEAMRLSLRARMDELRHLLSVSQGVAASLEMTDAISPVLEAALIDGAVMARVVLKQTVSLENSMDRLASYGMGPSANAYKYLDESIFELMHRQVILSIPNAARARIFNYPPGSPVPGSIVALALGKGEDYYGAFWVAFERPHQFTESQLNFLSTLAGQAYLAASNAHLYATAEIGRRRLEAVVTSTPDPILVIDEKLRLLMLNPAALQTPGLLEVTESGTLIEKAVGYPDLLDLILSPVSGKYSSKEIKLSNGKIYFASVASIIAEEKAVGKICILRDITHYKELDSLKSEFVSTVSHDLRSPLTLVRGYATMLEMVGDLNTQQKGYAQKIVLGVENMARLVNNLLDLGRIDAGIGLQIEPVLVTAIVDEVVSTLQPQALQKKIDFSSEYAIDRNTKFEADPALLKQALFNLAENAIKYSGVGGKVKISVKQYEDSIFFEVQDTGIGIAPLDLPHMFEKFYRSTRREAYQQSGTGLGLAIVKSIIERHGGDVGVESQLGTGTTFRIEIPLSQNNPENPDLDDSF
ncbi:MAG: HAMP domain-containing protein, partial [Anaerolineaceae bacterium]|nr:HAMP domain-containing protein [Anaerolineaceae bacterium]